MSFFHYMSPYGMKWIPAERADDEPRPLLADAQKISSVPFHGAPLKIEREPRYTGYDTLDVAASDVLSPTEWRYEEGPCEIHDMTIRPPLRLRDPWRGTATYQSIDRSFNKWWSPWPRKAVEGDIYPVPADVYWFSKQLAAAYRNITANVVKHNALYRRLVQRSRDELTGTG